MHIAIIWQRFLPYHQARLRHAHARLERQGIKLTAIEVASQDDSYAFPQSDSRSSFEHICCFPGQSYHAYSARAIFRAVTEVLVRTGPDVIFAPATPFPEGMAAVAYRCHHNKKLVMMDDAFERTDRCSFLSRLAKRAIHQNIDGAFIPALSHQAYYFSLGFPLERTFYGVDVVDNDFFSPHEGEARDRRSVREALGLPERYFLFVGRFLERKGIDLLVEAFLRYREATRGSVWDLVLVGTGKLPKESIGINGGIHLTGPRFGQDLCRLYSLAKACIVPSHADPWALVVNEAMASGLPVIVSRGCGAARTLVHEAENGWTFAPGDVEGLKRLMMRMTLLEVSTLARMGRKSQEIISDWSLNRFVDGLLASAAVPRRPVAGLLSEVLIRVWKGRVRVN